MASRTGVAFVVALVLAATVIAQVPPPGRRPGGPRGGSDLRLLMRPDVQRDIGLTQAQKTKLQRVQQSIMAQMGPGGRPGAPPRGGGQDRRQMMDKYGKQISAIVTAKQKARLKQISIQLEGMRAVTRPDIAKQIGLTAQQKARIDKLEANQRPGMMRPNGRPNQQNFDAMRKAFEKRRQALDAGIAKVLTPTQRATLKKLGGRTFKADANARMPFGRPR